MLKYSGKEGAFMRNDKDRFMTWKESKTKKVNVKTLHPVEIIRTYYKRQEEDPLLEEMWNNFKVPESAGDSIVLGTGSHK